MSIRIMTLVWERSLHSGGDLLVLLAIADYADDTGQAYPAVGTLAHKARMSERNCQYVLKRLVGSGELEVERRKGPGGCNLYRVKILHPEAGFMGGVKPVAPPRVKSSAPDPSSEPSVEPSSISETPVRRTGKKTWTQKDIRATYLLYPRLRKPLLAYKAIDKALTILWGQGHAHPVAHLQEQTRLFAAACMAEQKENQYIPYPASWYNGGDWLQEIKPAPCPKCHDPEKGIDTGIVWDEKTRENALCRNCAAGAEKRRKGFTFR